MRTVWCISLVPVVVLSLTVGMAKAKAAATLVAAVTKITAAAFVTLLAAGPPPPMKMTAAAVGCRRCVPFPS